jgi:XTP/dITP diphosphohydrolase
MKIILATWNPRKAAWLKNGFTNLNLPVEYIESEQVLPIDETGNTCEENALLKIACLALDEDGIIIGEDSGLFIDALNGFPGVNTLRWAEVTDDDRSKKILEMMKDVQPDGRSAYFKSSIAVKFSDGSVEVVSGIMRGKISESFLGETGKGYRNIFILKTGKYICESESDIVQRGDNRDLAIKGASRLISNRLGKKLEKHGSA